MNAKRLASGIAVTGILGVALLAGIGTTATAEAGPRGRTVTQRDHRQERAVRSNQKPKLVRERRTLTGRRVDVQQRRGEVRDRRTDVRHRRLETRHHRIERGRILPRTHIRVRPYRTWTWHRAWYRTAPRFTIDRSPFYFHAGLGIYLGGVLLDLELGDIAPAGYVYVDPYCHAEFRTIAAYRLHLHRHSHRPALRLVAVGICGN